MTQPIRSFNLDKLTNRYKSVDSAFLLSDDSVSFGPNSAYNVGYNYNIECAFEIPDTIVSGQVELLNLDDKLKLTVNSGMELAYYYNGNKRLSTTIQKDTYHTAALRQVNGISHLFLDGENKQTYNLALQDIYHFTGDVTATTSSINVPSYLYFTRIWEIGLFDYMISNTHTTKGDYARVRDSLISNWDFSKAVNGIVPDTSTNTIYGIVNDYSAHNRHNPYQSTVSPAWVKNTGSFSNTSTLVDYMSQRDDAFSIEGWVLISGVSSAGTLFRSNTNNIIFYLSASSELNLITIDRDSGVNLVTSTATIPDNAWTHVAASWEADSSSIYLSINGEVETKAASPLVGLDLTAVTEYLFGEADGYNFAVRNWRIYHKQLTEAEIKLAHKYPTEYPVNDTHVIADWRFVEDDTATVFDARQRGHDLVPTDGTTNWAVDSRSGFYPLMWDGYGITLKGNNPVGTNSNYINGENIVIEALFHGNSKFENEFGPSIETDPNVKYQQVYTSATGEYYAEDPAFSANKISYTDAKWHHVTSIHSDTVTLSGTSYNTVIYHNGVIADAYEESNTGVSASNVGYLSISGLVSQARIYYPTNSGMQDWFNGRNILYTPGFSQTDNNLVFNMDLDPTINSGLSGSTYFPVTGDIIRIPLGWKYYSVDGSLPEISTPKFSMASFTPTDNSYSLESTFRFNVDNFRDRVWAINSNAQQLYITSGLYYATVTPSVTVSGVISAHKWHNILYRYNGTTASLLLDGAEVWSGVSTDWSHPTDTVRYGFYANDPTKEPLVDIRRIAAYDSWLDEASTLTNPRSEDVAYLKLTENLYNM